MKSVACKCITILTASSAENVLVDDLEALGIHGCSVTDARGRGIHGARPGKWASGNIRMDVVVPAAQVPRVLELLERHRQSNVLVGWVSDVEAFPAEKFGG